MKGFAVLRSNLFGMFVRRLERYIASPVGKEGAGARVGNVPRKCQKLVFPVRLCLHGQPPKLGFLYFTEIIQFVKVLQINILTKTVHCV
jgi:hypothetical protein